MSDISKKRDKKKESSAPGSAAASSAASSNSRSTAQGTKTPEISSNTTEKPLRKSEQRAKDASDIKEAKQAEKVVLREKYDPNLQHSDDSSDEEVLLRTGNVPKEWYDLYDHKGYSVSGKQVIKMEEGDELSKFLERQEDPKRWWAKITDYLNNKEVKLSEADLELLQRVRTGQFADKDVDPFRWDHFQDKHPEMMHPFSEGGEKKSRFVQSKWERLKISKYMKALKKGWMKTLAEKAQDKQDELNKEDAPWDIWQDESIVSWRPRRMPKPITAPKRDLPGHNESFNPPEEYLFDEQELKDYEEAEEGERKQNFIPQQFEALRKVPLYDNLIKEHFERCLDLYMCPRMFKKKIDVSDPSKLIPELPSPEELRPFPTKVSIEYHFHKSCVRSIALSPNGMWLASGDEDSNLVIFNARTARVVRSYKLHNKVVDDLHWCPDTDRCILVVANEDTVHLVAPALYSKHVNANTKLMLSEAASSYAIESVANQKAECSWAFPEATGSSLEMMVTLTLKNVISKVCWHPKGDYISTMASGIQSSSQVLIHSVSKATSQKPFSTTKGIIQCIAFHPLKPHFFAATHTTVFQYNLQKQSIVQKYKSGAKWISSITMHKGGDNFVLGTYDKKVLWFDMDMSGEKPYKQLKYQTKAIRDVAISHANQVPLFSSASDDGTVNIFYGQVYNDLMTDPMIVPLKVLKAHAPDQKTGLGAMQCVWHPQQPWIYTAGGDCKIRMWS